MESSCANLRRPVAAIGHPSCARTSAASLGRGARRPGFLRCRARPEADQSSLLSAFASASWLAAALSASKRLWGIGKSSRPRLGSVQRAASGQAASASRRQSLCSASLLLAGAAGLLPRGCSAAEGGDDEVEAVVDGDTVKLAKFGRCRLIGVNTPETVSPKQKAGAPPDCFGPEASSLTKQLLPKGTKVRVELDAGPTDRYGRELIYLYRSQDSMFVNAELVKQGVARRMKVAPNVKYDDLFKKLEQEAATSGKGLWKACPVGAASSAPAASKSSAPAGAVLVADGGPGDSKSCKDFATYDEAKAWFDTYFPLYGDVAKLDGDGDGKPCEKLLKKGKGK